METPDESIPLRSRRQLANSMQHMQYAVTADPMYHRPPKSTSPETETETDDYGVPKYLEPTRRPHDPKATSNAEKGADPFAFGSRYLSEGDDVFSHNAWDHVETDDAYKDFAETQYAAQRAAPVSDFDRHRFNAFPERFWNTFYSNNTSNFFKNRKWLAQEFPVLSQITAEGAQPCTVLEVGAGAGNTAFPILAINKNPGFKIHACDFSKKAVDLIRTNEAYDDRFIQADVWDVAASQPAVASEEDFSLPPGLSEGSVDIVIMIFIFSALSPSQWRQAVHNIHRVLRPGGIVLFRDYGRGDLAQVRFKKGRWMEENFYVRGDGTRVYFFEQDQLKDIWTAGRVGASDGNLEDATTEDGEKSLPKFELLNIGTDRRLLVNRQRKLKMYRCWLQARLRKSGPALFADLPPPQPVDTLPAVMDALNPNHGDLAAD